MAKPKVKITERGWAGHFCAASDCRYRRNTLIEKGRKRVVVSTVGNYWPPHATREEGNDHHRKNWIGVNRFYETMAFKAVKEGVYWEADVSQQVEFKSEWMLSELEQETDLKADAMHEAVVKEIASGL